MLQCILTGKVQDVYLSLSTTDCLKYSMVRSAVLKAYELVPKAYRQCFQRWRQGDKSHLGLPVIYLVILIIGAQWLKWIPMRACPI